jgi:hypothetical protein
VKNTTSFRKHGCYLRSTVNFATTIRILRRAKFVPTSSNLKQIVRAAGYFSPVTLKVLTKGFCLDLVNGRHYVVQRYITKPFLIEGLKFDMRIYVLLAGT